MKTFKAISTEKAQIIRGAGRRLRLMDAGQGFFLIHAISDIANPKRMVTISNNATIWLKDGDFARA
jgi:hypothetical protein